MKFEMDGELPLLPDAPAVSHEKTELLQVMIREFMALHYQLACGKELTSTPWTSIAKQQVRLWDSDMWPSGVIIQDPSKIVLGDCQNIVALWRRRQAHGGSSYTFRFNFYINSEGLQPAIYREFTPPESQKVAPTAGHILATPSTQMADSAIGVPFTQHHISTTPPRDVEGQEGMQSIEGPRRRVRSETPPVPHEINLPTPGQSIDGTAALGVDKAVGSPEEPESDPTLGTGKQRKQYTALCRPEKECHLMYPLILADVQVKARRPLRCRDHSPISHLNLHTKTMIPYPQDLEKRVEES
jgi:hypothetical protein